MSFRRSFKPRKSLAVAYVAAGALLSEADIAMYQAKAAGKGRCHVYRPTDGPQTAQEGPVPRMSGTVRPPSVPRPA